MISKKMEFAAAKFCIAFLVLIFAVTFIRILSRTIILKTERVLPFGKVIFFDKEDLQIPDSMAENNIQWSKQYPFFKDIENQNNSQSISEEFHGKAEAKNIKLKFTPVAKATEKIQTWIVSNFILRTKLINFCSIINSFFYWRPMGIFFSQSGVVELSNGHFTEYVSKGNVMEKVESLKAYYNFLRTKNIPLLYVQAPYKIDPNDKMISGVSDFSNQNADEFLKQIALNKINFIDMRKEIEKTGKDFYSFFYKTDHHWTAEAGLWATRIIAEKLNSDFGLEIDSSIYETENFNYTIYKKSFLGSRGRTRKLPLEYMEDITLIEPKERYALTVDIYSSAKNIRQASGGFETLIFKENLQNFYNAQNENAYAIYVDGDRMMQIENHSSKNKTRVLILGDSFTDVVEPFLCLGVAQLDCVDLRVFNGSLRTWINTHEHYDACVFLINPGIIAGKINKSSHTDLWDFQ